MALRASASVHWASSPSKTWFDKTHRNSETLLLLSLSILLSTSEYCSHRSSDSLFLSRSSLLLQRYYAPSCNLSEYLQLYYLAISLGAHDAYVSQTILLCYFTASDDHEYASLASELLWDTMGGILEAQSTPVLKVNTSKAMESYETASHSDNLWKNGDPYIACATRR